MVSRASPPTHASTAAAASAPKSPTSPGVSTPSQSKVTGQGVALFPPPPQPASREETVAPGPLSTPGAPRVSHSPLPQTRVRTRQLYGEKEKQLPGLSPLQSCDFQGSLKGYGGSS